MEIIHAKGLEHHLQSAVTSRAPEPGAPIAEGTPVRKPAPPSGMPGMPSRVVGVPDTGLSDPVQIARHFLALQDRVARLERFLLLSANFANVGELDAAMDEREQAQAKRQRGPKAPAPDVSGKVPAPDTSGKVPKPGETSAAAAADTGDAPSSEN